MNSSAEAIKKKCNFLIYTAFLDLDARISLSEHCDTLVKPVRKTWIVSILLTSLICPVIMTHTPCSISQDINYRPLTKGTLYCTLKSEEHNTAVCSPAPKSCCVYIIFHHCFSSTRGQRFAGVHPSCLGAKADYTFDKTPVLPRAT